jgi:hypothetical protein
MEAAWTSETSSLKADKKGKLKSHSTPCENTSIALTLKFGRQRNIVLYWHRKLQLGTQRQRTHSLL